MRRPTPSTVNTLNNLKNETQLSWRVIAEMLGFEAQPWASRLSAVSRSLPGSISKDLEDILRTSMGLQTIDRPRKPRKSRGFDAYLVTLFDMERDRRGLTNSEYLEALMGISGT